MSPPSFPRWTNSRRGREVRDNESYAPERAPRRGLRGAHVRLRQAHGHLKAARRLGLAGRDLLRQDAVGALRRNARDKGGAAQHRRAPRARTTAASTHHGMHARAAPPDTHAARAVLSSHRPTRRSCARSSHANPARSKRSNAKRGCSTAWPRTQTSARRWGLAPRRATVLACCSNGSR